MLSLDFYYCPTCKNIVQVVNKGIASISCCGEEMIKIEPNAQDAALEKHVPVVHFEGNTASIFVGEVEHPMQQDHYITKICAVTEDGVYIKELKFTDKPEVTFDIGDSNKAVIYAYCNNHGLWKAEVKR